MLFLLGDFINLLYVKLVMAQASKCSTEIFMRVQVGKDSEKPMKYANIYFSIIDIFYLLRPCSCMFAKETERTTLLTNVTRLRVH